MARIYCAGPLFNDSERREMSAIAAVLEAAGHETFLPHRDGLEFARLLPELEAIAPAAADVILQRAVFSLDVFQLLTRSDAVVANLNGRVPDEGTVVEAALAWLAGKAIVLFKNDSRTVLSGSDHPMVLALGESRIVGEIDDVPRAVDAQLRADHKDRVPALLEVGRRIAEVRQRSRRDLAAALVTLAS